MEGIKKMLLFASRMSILYDKIAFRFTARRRAAAKRKKLKHLGKSRSTDTEDEENEDEPDEGI